MADIQTKSEPVEPKKNGFSPFKDKKVQKYFIILGVGMFMSFISLTVFALGTSFEEGYITSICFLPSVTFIIELTAFLQLYWGILVVNDYVRRRAIIAYLIFGILLIFYAVLFIAPTTTSLFIDKRNIEMHIELYWIGCAFIFVQGIGYLILGILGWKKILAKVEPATVTQTQGEGQELQKPGEKQVLRSPGQGQVLQKPPPGGYVLQEKGMVQKSPVPAQAPAPVKR